MCQTCPLSWHCTYEIYFYVLQLFLFLIFFFFLDDVTLLQSFLEQEEYYPDYFNTWMIPTIQNK